MNKLGLERQAQVIKVLPTSQERLQAISNGKILQ